jgi:hypothetical protein
VVLALEELLLWVEESVDDIVDVVEDDEDESGDIVDDEDETTVEEMMVEETTKDVDDVGLAEDRALLVEVDFVRDFDEETELQVPNKGWQFFSQYAEVDPLPTYQCYNFIIT